MDCRLFCIFNSGVFDWICYLSNCNLHIFTWRFFLRHEIAKLDGDDKPRRLFRNKKADVGRDVSQHG